MRTFGPGRYGILAALLLVFLAGMGALATFNHLLAQRTAESLSTASEIARQQAQPQVILASTQLLRNDLAARRYLGRVLRDLDTAIGAMDAAVLQLEQHSKPAGHPALAFLKSTPLDFWPLATPRSRALQQALQQQWAEYRQHLDPILRFKSDPYVETAEDGAQLSPTGAALSRALDDAVRFGIAHHQTIARHIGDLAAAVESGVHEHTGQLRQWLIVGLGASAVLLLIMLLLIHSLGRNERRLSRAKHETDDILRTVNQGLFLLDEQLHLGSERSEALEQIFRRNDFSKLDFASLLRGLVPEKTLQTASEYVKLLWGERVNEKLIKTINPLSEVEVHLEAGGGKVDTQYLEFDFNRVRTDGQMSRILVTVNDVTRRVELARELLESQEKAQAQLDLLLHILHVDPHQLSAFLEESEVGLKMVNAILKEPAREETAFRAKLDRLFREVHGVKGEAAALGLKTVEQRAHSFEEALSELRKRDKLGGNDFLPLVVKLDDLFAHLAQVREMIGRLADLRVAMSSDGTPAPALAPADKPKSEPREIPVAIAAEAEAEVKTEESAHADTLIQRPPEALELLRQSAAGGDLESALTQLAQRIAHKQSKQVEVNCTGLERVPTRYRKPLKDIAIQMMRNSLAHGIETPQERARQNKNAAGSVVVRFENHGADGCELVFQDDGRGLSAPQLKEKAVERGLMSAEQAAALDERRALSLIFMAGFSTQAQVSEDAGRGVGMDLVRAKVLQLGGKVGISTTAGKFLRFRIWLPALSEVRAA